jgi:putative ABC transport system permease protein
MLTKGQVHHISRRIKSQGVNSFMLENELIDFVSCIVEEQMQSGMPFGEAVETAIQQADLGKASKAHKSTVMISKPNSLDMLQNFLKIGFRNFLKYKVNTSINVFGLMLGLSTSLIIGLYLKQGFSYDTMYSQVDQLYRVNSISHMGQSPSHITSVSPELRDALLEDLPEVARASDLQYLYVNKPLKWEGRTFFDYRFAAVQQDFFEMFDLSLLEGNQDALFDGPYGVFLSASMAGRVFGENDPVGEIITVTDGGKDQEFTVKGVFADMPDNSHFKSDQWAGFDLLTSIVTKRVIKTRNPGWTSINDPAYVQLTAGASEEEVNEKINAMLKKRVGGKIWYEHYLQPVNDIHLNKRGFEISSSGDLDQLYLFSIVAVLILIIACINYVNLTTAQAAVRLKEVGIRKVIGAKKKQFIFQFLTEAGMVSLFAMLLSLIVVYLAIPKLNAAFSLNLSFSLAEDLVAISGFFLIILVVSLLCGTYPGFYLSRLKPNHLLKTGAAIKSGGGLFRKVLVTLQYATSITLVIATLIIADQLQYLSKRDLGFDKEEVLNVKIGYQQSQKYGETFLNEVLSQPGVMYASLTGNTLGDGNMSGNRILVGDMTDEEGEMHEVLAVDLDYEKALGLQMTEGRWFTKEFGTDRAAAYVVNEAFVRHFGLEQPVGMKLDRNGQSGTIVGVTKDFHFKSMKYSIEPLVMHMAPRDKFGYWNMAIRLAPEAGLSVIDQLEASWESIVPDYPFDYEFLDDQIEAFYQSDRDFANMFSVFSLLAIAVSCLGLIGLVSFSTKRRSKEIGVRKVLGATVAKILGLISRDMAWLILLGALVAIPVAYLFMQQWLENFEYRTTISYWPFIAALVLTLAISWLSVSYISLRAAKANPVDSLRSD